MAFQVITPDRFLTNWTLWLRNFDLYIVWLRLCPWLDDLWLRSPVGRVNAFGRPGLLTFLPFIPSLLGEVFRMIHLNMAFKVIPSDRYLTNWALWLQRMTLLNVTYQVIPLDRFLTNGTHWVWIFDIDPLMVWLRLGPWLYVWPWCPIGGVRAIGTPVPLPFKANSGFVLSPLLNS